MRLELNAKELLALHNVLYERFEGDNARFGSAQEPIHASLRQVYYRLKGLIVAAMGKKSSTIPTVAEDFLRREQAKIDALEEQPEIVVAFDVNDNVNDYVPPNYPRHTRRRGKQ